MTDWQEVKKFMQSLTTTLQIQYEFMIWFWWLYVKDLSYYQMRLYRYSLYM